MKPIFTIFSRIMINNILSGLFIVSSLFWITLISTKINGFDSFINIGLGIIIFLSFCLYLITQDFLPLVRIDDYGVTAFSIFWKRKLSWKEINNVEIISLDKYGIWEKNSELKKTDEFEKGYDFIFLSKQEIKIPKRNVNSYIFSHGKITDKSTIAFAFEKKSWAIINEKLKTKHSH